MPPPSSRSKRGKFNVQAASQVNASEQPNKCSPGAATGGVRGGMHDVAAAARFREGLIAGDRFVRGAEGRVDLDRSHDRLSNGGLNFEEGANGDEK